MKINELEGYIGYTGSDIYGVEVDVVNKTFTRLASAGVNEVVYDGWNKTIISKGNSNSLLNK